MRGLSAALLLLAAASGCARHADVEVGVAAEADGTRTLSHEIVVPAPAAEVWQAVATAEGWRTWAVPLAREVPGAPDRFETGYAPDAEPGGPATIEQQWVAREAPHRVAFRTTRTPAGFPHAEAYRQVTSSLVLTPLGPRATRVRLTASGYPAGPAGDALLAFFRQGNCIALRQLHQRFASGPIDWAARRAQSRGEMTCPR